MSSLDLRFDGSKVAADYNNYKPIEICVGPATPSDQALVTSLESAFKRFSSSLDQTRDHSISELRVAPTNLEAFLRQALSNHLTRLVTRRAYLGQLVAALITAVSDFIESIPLDRRNAVIDCLESAVLTLIGHPAFFDALDAVATAIAANVVLNVKIRAMDDDSSIDSGALDHIGVHLDTDTENAVKGYSMSVTAQMRNHVAIRNALTEFTEAAIHHSVSSASLSGETVDLLEDAVKKQFGDLSRLAAVGDALDQVANAAADDAVSSFNERALEAPV